MRPASAVARPLTVATVAVALALGATACSSDDTASDPVPTPGPGATTTAPDPADPTALTTARPPATSAVETAVDDTGPPTPAEGSLYARGDIDEGLRPWIADATDALAARLDVPADTIGTVSAVLVRWPDAALGCAEPGRQYAQVVTDGAVIELEHDGAVYRFHGGGDREPFLCPRPITEAPPAG